ncbi:hypothetical protein [Azospirillum canadense]|uniref:hypothetical protein n=1 Tax=Azospirillum canadense TaxID=403962 RepID=UPI0022261CCA|nr:hypothetical protein [Azospirillum canadense]MCW2240555.1 hypothetical protein [Azospirillum canadense]
MVQTVPGRIPLWLRKAGLILRRWLEEPVGVFVPLFAALLMLFAPQMPDMFAGMVVGTSRTGQSEEVWWKAALGLGLAAAALGVMAWYWTRAALWESCTYAHRVMFFDRIRGAQSVLPSDRMQMAQWLDEGRLPHATLVGWSHDWAPRIAILFAAAVALAPLIWVVRSEEVSLADVRWGTVLAGPAFLLALFPAAVMRRRLGLTMRTQAPLWMWRARPTAVLAAAPFGWPVALLLLLLSVAGGIVTGVFPEIIEERLSTPTAALLALALLIGPLVVALALFRDIATLVLLGLVAAVTALRDAIGRGRASVVGRVDLAGLSRVLGTLMLLCTVFYRPFLGEPSGHYAVRTTGDPLNEQAVVSCRIGPDGRLTSGTALPGTLRRPTVAEALWEWYDARLAAGYPGNRPMPLIIVTAEGGASRAAVWLLSAMRTLDARTDGAFGRQLFAISGVSGGSLGAVTYLQALRLYGKGKGELDWDRPEVQNGLRQLGSGDLLAATIATYFLNDSLGRLLGTVWPAPDRGVALERAFERHWSGPAAFHVPEAQARMGLVALRNAGPKGMPHLVLNGTDRETGRRLITSTFRFNPEDDVFAGSDDLLTILCRDVPSSTAVTNSARFPYVSPAGRFVDWEEKRHPASSASTAVHQVEWEAKDRQVLDGGYFENYGARTAAELVHAVERIARKPASDGRTLNVVPVVVVVSNDADAARNPREPDEWDLPSLGEVTIACPMPSEVLAAAPGLRPLPVETAVGRIRKDSRNTPELLIPMLGLAATRGAHGQEALYSLRRQNCSTEPGADPRLMHIALPAPRRGKEAAPMNWVLNPTAANFLINIAPETGFNLKQAGLLEQALRSMRDRPPISNVGMP